MFECYNVHKHLSTEREEAHFFQILRTLKQKIDEHRPDFVNLVLSVLVLFHLSICMIPLPSPVCPFL